MFLTNEQASARLESKDNLANKFSKKVTSVTPDNVVEKRAPRSGKHGDSENLTKEERNEVAIRARLGERQEVLASEFEITPGNVSHIKTGKTKGIDEEAVSARITEVRDSALDRLMSSLGLLTDDKLSGCSAKDLSVIASNMGRVVEKTMPKSEGTDKVQVIIYAPELRKESSFQSVEI